MQSASTASVGLCVSQSDTVNSCWFAALSGGDGYKKAFSAFLPTSYINAKGNLPKDVATNSAAVASYLISIQELATQILGGAWLCAP